MARQERKPLAPSSAVQSPTARLQRYSNGLIE